MASTSWSEDYSLLPYYTSLPTILITTNQARAPDCPRRPLAGCRCLTLLRRTASEPYTRHRANALRRWLAPPPLPLARPISP